MPAAILVPYYKHCLDCQILTCNFALPMLWQFLEWSPDDAVAIVIKEKGLLVWVSNQSVQEGFFMMHVPAYRQMSLIIKFIRSRPPVQYSDCRQLWNWPAVNNGYCKSQDYILILVFTVSTRCRRLWFCFFGAQSILPHAGSEKTWKRKLAEHWWLKPEVSWVWLLATAAFLLSSFLPHNI